MWFGNMYTSTRARENNCITNNYQSTIFEQKPHFLEPKYTQYSHTHLKGK